MKKNLKNMLILIGAILILSGILVDILKPSPVIPPDKDYTKEIKALNDSIAKVLKDTKGYQQEWARLEKEKDELKGLITKIVADNEKTNFELVNGSLDDNIKFLSDYLSTESGNWKGYSSNYNRPPIKADKSGPE